MSKKHPPRRTNVAFSPRLLQFAVELYEMLALKCCTRGGKTTHRRLNTSIPSETNHSNMMVDPHVKKTHFPRQANSGTWSGPMSKKHPPRRTPVAFSPLLLQFAVELYEMLALKCCARGCKTTHRRLNTSILSETYHCHMMVDPYVKKTHFPGQDNSGTCSGPMSKKQSRREMIMG